MADRGGEAALERRGERVDPLGLEAVCPQAFDLVAQVLALLGVGGETEAADAPERIAREALDRIELVLGPAPERERAVAADRGDDLVVRRSRATERKAAVPAARSLGDPPRVHDAHAQPGLGEGERTRAARHPSADDADVHVLPPVAAREARPSARPASKASSPRDRTAHHAFLHRDPARELEQRESRPNCARGEPGRAGELVSRSRAVAERLEHGCTGRVVRHGGGGQLGARGRPPRERPRRRSPGWRLDAGARSSRGSERS